MSNRLGIAQAHRLRTYELLKGQSESVIRRALNLRPGQDAATELESLRQRLERLSDPAPDLGHQQDDEEYNPREQEAIARMKPRVKAIYLAIREAAERGDLAPRYTDLEEVIQSHSDSVARALKQLEKLGAVVRIRASAAKLGAIYRLPLAGLETRRP